jgi:hypothetical protein
MFSIFLDRATRRTMVDCQHGSEGLEILYSAAVMARSFELGIGTSGFGLLGQLLSLAFGQRTQCLQVIKGESS